MLVRLILLLTLVPLAELVLLLWLSDALSWQLTVAWVLATGIGGAWMIRRQGWKAWRRIRDELAAGRLPGDALLDGLVLLTAGMLLLTPGVLTDALAIGLMIPAGRAAAKRWIKLSAGGMWKSWTQSSRYPFGPQSPVGGDATEPIDVPFRSADEARLTHEPEISE